MKRKNDPKAAFLSDRPKLLQYIRDVDFSLREVISIEVKREGSLHRYIFRGLGFWFVVETDSEFSFFKNRLKFNEIMADL
ncbi:MAG: hypothetical protein JNL11_12120 [Bdellovibrionaceae bacterium]|nr:hypothetical protein [Pseudobdellovibrionaceae bacterium]